MTHSTHFMDHLFISMYLFLFMCNLEINISQIRLNIVKKKRFKKRFKKPTFYVINSKSFDWSSLTCTDKSFK